jgi:hypothetical protein
MRRLLCSRRLIPACVVLLFLGCGPAGGVKLQGKIVKDGQPYAAPSGETLTLSLNGKDAEGKAAIYPAAVNSSDGTFDLKGTNGAGVPPGTYQINLSTSTASTDPAALNKMDELKQKFAAVNGKDCVIAAGDAGKTITIDIGKGTVTK